MSCGDSPGKVGRVRPERIRANSDGETRECSAGSVARGHEPNQAGSSSYKSAYPERSAPTVVNHNVGDERRRETRAGSDTGEDPAVSNAALGHGNPARYKPIGCRIDHRLARAEQKTHCHK